MQAGLAREVISRFQRLRKQAGLVVSDGVEAFYAPLPASEAPGATSAASAAVMETMLASPQGAAVAETLGRPLLPMSRKPAHAVVIASIDTKVEGGGQDGGGRPCRHWDCQGPPVIASIDTKVDGGAMSSLGSTRSTRLVCLVTATHWAMDP